MKLRDIKKIINNMSFFNWIGPSKKEKPYRTFGQTMAKWVVIWITILVSLLFLSLYVGHIRQKIVEVNVPVKEIVYNSQCDLSFLKLGDSIHFENKNKIVTNIHEYSWGEVDITLNNRD